METGDPFDTEVEIITAKGNRRRIHVIGKAVFTDGKITHRLGVTQDITERKRTEDILRNNEEKFRRLFEAVSDSLFLIDNETGQIYETNSSAVKMYGYSREELLTKRNVDMSAEPDSTREATLSRKSFVPVRWHKKRTERYSL
jgi:PAS domain-containing protein